MTEVASSRIALRLIVDGSSDVARVVWGQVRDALAGQVEINDVVIGAYWKFASTQEVTSSLRTDGAFDDIYEKVARLLTSGLVEHTNDPRDIFETALPRVQSAPFVSRPWMTHVFVVQHVHESEDGQDEDVKFIGVYHTRSDAEAAIARLLLQRGFCDHPDGFEITEYPLNKDHWTEGFVSWKEATEEDPNGEQGRR